MSTTLSSAAAAALVGNSRDLVGEILNRLPLSSVMRFRLVCKEWCSLTSTQSFIDMYQNINQPGPPHCRAGNNNSCFAVQYFDNGTESKYDHFNTLFFNLELDNNNNDMKMKRIREYMDLSNIFSQVGEDGHVKMYKTVTSSNTSFFHKIKAYYHIKLISSCGGFLLFTAKPPVSRMGGMFSCWQPMEEEYLALILYNPVTKEQLTVIAPPPSKYVYCGFYYHSPTKEHRILYRLIEVDSPPPDPAAADGIVTFLVIELRNDYFMIRRINLKCPKISIYTYYYLPDTSTPPVISNGSLHWIVSEDDRHGHIHRNWQIPACSYTILSFGMESEEFRFMGHPTLSHPCVRWGSNGHRHKMNLLEMEGGVLCLCNGYGGSDHQHPKPILEIYVMEDYEKWTWVRRYLIDLNGYIDKHYCEYGLHYKSLQILQGDDQLLLQVHHPAYTTLNVEYALYSLNEEQLEYCLLGRLRRMIITPDKKKKKVVGNMVVLTPSLASIFQRNRSSATDQIPIKFIFIENGCRLIP